MILVKGKALSYNEAARHLKKLHDEREQAREDLEAAEENVYELEGEVSDLNFQINQILDQMRAEDLTEALPTNLLLQGFKLTSVLTKPLSDITDIWGEQPKISSRLTILEDSSGNVIREWGRNPSLTDLFEVSAKYS